jgi:hypothetical protein
MADWGKIASDAIQSGIAIIIAARLRSVQEEYTRISISYYSHYYQLREFYFNTFETQGEGPFTYEQFSIPFYVPDYVGTFRSGYFPPGAWYLFNSELSFRINAIGSNSVAGYWQGYARRYSPYGALTLDTSSYAMDLACVLDDWNSYMNRYEEHKRDVLNERRWASQIGALQFGTKEGYAIERGLATSFEIFDTAQGQLTSSLDTIANGLATHAGYRRMQEALENDLGTNPILMNNFFLESNKYHG